MMKFTQIHTYKQNLETILKFYQDEALVTAKMIALGSRNIEFESVINEEGLPTITIQREVGADAPEALRRFIARWNKSSQTDVWTGEPGGPYTCHMIFYTSAPVNVTASMELRATAKGCTNKTKTEIISSVPILGEMIGKYVQKAIMEAVREEYLYIVKHAEAESNRQ